MGNTWRRYYTGSCARYAYSQDKMLPLSPGEFTRPFLLTFTLILAIHKHELLNSTLPCATMYTYWHLPPMWRYVRQQTSHWAMFVPKIHDPTVALIIIMSSPWHQTHAFPATSRVLVFRTDLAFTVFSISITSFQRRTGCVFMRVRVRFTENI